jgi:hypothetical protein
MKLQGVNYKCLSSFVEWLRKDEGGRMKAEDKELGIPICQIFRLPRPAEAGLAMTLYLLLTVYCQL